MELGRPSSDLESADELFENAPCGYLTTFVDGRIAKVNQTFLTWTGYDRATVLSGKRFKDLLTVPGRIYHDTHVAPLVQMQSFVREVAFDVLRFDGTVLPVLFNCVRQASADETGSLMRIIIFDATDRRQYERELLLARRTADQATITERQAREQGERANRSKDEFLALVSHELRTPLSAILGWAQVLRKRNPDNVEIQHGLEIIERNTRLQVRLVDDLMDMSRMLSGKLRLEVQRVELANVIEAALETTRPAAHARGIRLQSITDATVFVSGDPDRLQQVFWNLLSNSVKFTPKEGSVRVVMERVNSHIEVSVIDNGQGMSQEFLAYAFDRFRQSDSAATRGTAGLGLGLSICKSLVEMHGGSIEAGSEGEGLGSTFVVKLPVVVSHSREEARVHPRAAVNSTSPQLPGIRLNGLKVLVVDDEPDARDVLSRILRSCGADVIEAATASEAVRATEVSRPHILISDVGMPGEDGYELIRRVRMLGESGSIPAIALTAFSRLEDRTRAMLAGFQIHLTKPIESEELIVTVASLSGRLGPTQS